jgi:DNA processing protein
VQDTAPHPLPSPADRPGDWIRLQQCAGVGPATASRLFKHFATPRAIFEASPAALAAALGDDARPQLVRALLAAPSEQTLRLTEATLAWLEQADHHLLAVHDGAYPNLLRQMDDAPVLLYAKGNPALLARRSLAIVGSRNASTQGKANAFAFARALSQAGLTIVSGMALGIDAAAHEGGLQGPGATVAVLGTGIDRVYPSRNHALSRQVAEQGCLVSEYPLGYPVLKENFPRRNRIISGMTQGVLVVEAALGSGSLITARLSVELNREVFALPGSIHAPLSKGCHKLIRQGAKLVDSIADILADLALDGPAPGLPAAGEPLDPVWQGLLDALGEGPVEPALLAELSTRELGQLYSRLLSLELAGHVERLPGGRYQRIVPAGRIA